MKLLRCNLKPQATFIMLLLWVLLNLAPCYGQTVTASLSGTITDPTGAAIPEASVTATKSDTGLPTKTASGPGGDYTFPSLSPGTYNLTVERTGFKSAVLTGIKLLVDQKAVIDINSSH